MTLRLTRRLPVAVAVFIALALSSACSSSREVPVDTADNAIAIETPRPDVSAEPASSRGLRDTAEPSEEPAVEPTSAPAVEATEPVAESANDALYFVDVYDPNRDAFADLDAALATAQTTERRVLVIVGGDWCPDCVNLDNFIDERPELEAALIDQYHFVKLNVSDENDNAEFLGQYPDFSWVPHFYIFDADGTLANSVDTRFLMANGVFDDDAFAAFLAGSW